MGSEEVPRGSGFDQFGHMVGSGSAATRARRVELAGKHHGLTSCLKNSNTKCLLMKHKGCQCGCAHHLLLLCMMVD